MKKLLCAMAAFGLLLAGCGSKEANNETEEKEKLVVLTNSGYPPYEELDEEGNLYGFDIDLITRLGEIAGYDIEIQDVDFDSIVPSIKTGKADIGIAGITPSKERAESVDFSDVYYSGEDSQNYLLYKDGSGISSQDDLAGKTIGCQIGTVQYEAALTFEEEQGAVVDAKKDYASILAEINKGTDDCAIVELAVAKEFAKDNPDYKYVKLEGLEDLEGNAMCFAKGSELVEIFNNALQEMKDSGELDELISQYF